jgi:sensor domain CHASE-containing protein
MKSLRTQTLLYLLLLMAAVGLVSYLAGVHVMNGSMASYEDRLATERYTRVVQATEAAANSLQRSASANAIWDEARGFLGGAAASHMEDNYQRSALDTYSTDFVLFLKPDGRFHAAVDGRGDEVAFLTADDGRFSALVTELGIQREHLTRQGGFMIRQLDGQPVMMSYAGITSSDPAPEESVAGWLVFASMLDQDAIAGINKSAGAVASVFAENQAVSGLSASMSAPLKDSFGVTGLMLASDAAPSMDGQRNVSQSMMAFNTIILVILAALAVSVLLDRLVLRRLAHFSELAQKQQAGLALGEAVVWPVRDSDELDTLAVSLNSLVDNLRSAEHTLREEQAEIIEAKR